MPLEIKNKADYERVKNQQEAALNTLHAKGQAERWPSNKLLDALATTALPYMLALNDPANPVARQETNKIAIASLSQQGSFTALPQGQHKGIQEIVTQHTNALNEKYGKNYPVPTVLTGNFKISLAGYMMTGDVLVIDNETLTTKANDKSFWKGLLGHELGHRYLRGEDRVLPLIKSNFARALNLPLDAQTLSEVRKTEAIADFTAAQISKPSDVKQLITEVSRLDQTAMGQFLLETFKNAKIVLPDISEARTLYDTLPPQSKKLLNHNFSALPKREQDALTNRALEAEQDQEKYATHPSLLNRSKLQETLSANPQILACKDVRLDGSANIISAQDCGPNKVTSPTPTKRTEMIRK
ncbi:MAG: hypothetical protein V4735_02790 [Pseudomonadota bacterium]